MQQANSLTDQWLEYIFEYLATILSTEYVRKWTNGTAFKFSVHIFSQSNQALRPLSRTLFTIFSTKFVKNVLPGLVVRICEDATITQRLSGRGRLCTRRVCLKIGLEDES
jgi:hypothetical protein